MKIILAALSLLILTGCYPHPLKGGRASYTGTNTVVEQSENPKDQTSHIETSRQASTMTIPAGTGVEFGSAKFKADQPLTVNMNDEKSIQTTFGGAQEDTSRKIAAVAKSLLPVMLVGIALFVGGGVLLYFGWFTPAWICFGMGIIAIVLYVALPQMHPLILLGFLAAAGGITVVIFYAYNKGRKPEEVTTSTTTTSRPDSTLPVPPARPEE